MRIETPAGRAWRGLALLCLMSLTGSCRASHEALKGEPLPFHVALIPTEIHDTSVLSATSTEPRYEEPPPGAPADDLRLELSSAAVSRALRAELEQVFVRTTLLELPDDSAQLARLGPFEREQYWQARARAAGADLLLRPRLTFDPVVTGERNEKFWLNLPLFLLGGPMCYFVGDRSYGLTARLQAEIFDASEGHESLADYALLTIPLYAEFDSVDLRFLDRASGAGDYALSLLIPAGLLARETDAIEAELEERLPTELGRELAAKVFAERSQFEQNPALGAFRLEAGAARLEPIADGCMRVRVPVQELGTASPLNRYEIRAGDRLLASRNFSSTASVDGRRFIEADLELPPGAQFLSVRVVDASSNVRSYTLPIKAPTER